MIRVDRRLLGLLLAATAWLSHPGSAQTKRAMTVDDFLALRTIGDPAVSPDGSKIAFTVSVPSLADDRTISKIWIHDVSSGVSRELTGGSGSDRLPRWSGDGKSVVFLSTRGGSSQVWRLRLDGGEPRQISSLPDGVNEFWLSPDTTVLLATSDIKWPTESELDARTKGYQTAAKIWSSLFYRHWNEWRAGVRQHLFRIIVGTGRATDLTPRDRDIPTLALSGGDLAVSPLGTEIAVVYNPDTVVATSTNNDIFFMSPDGTGVAPMTDSRGNDHSPSYSPNARWIAYLSMTTPGFEADRQQLMLYDRAVGSHAKIASDWDVAIQSIRWLPDSRGLVVEVEEKGGHNIYEVSVPSGSRTLLVSGGFNTSPIPLANESLVFVRSTAAVPPELYLFRRTSKTNGAKVAAGQLTKLTSINDDALDNLDLKPAERFGFVGAKNDSVFGWIIKPPNFVPTHRYPVVYLIHGGPQGAWLDMWHPRWNYAMFAARGYVVAAVNFHGSTGYGQAFTNSISRNWGGLPYDDLMKGVGYLEKLPYVDTERIGAAGASYGGYMIYWIAGHTERFKVLVAHDGVFNPRSMAGSTEELWFPNWEFGGESISAEGRRIMEQWSPANYTYQWKTPILIVHGQQDFRVDVSEGFQAFTAAQLRKVPSKFLYFPDEGHFVTKPRNRRLWWGTVLDWLDQYLRGTFATE